MAILGVAVVFSALLLPGIEVNGAPSSQVLSIKPLSGANAITPESTQSIIDKVNTAKLVQSSLVEPLLVKVDPRKGLLVLEYQDALPKGTRIEPAFTTKGKTATALVTQNPSWLFMIDEEPGAHFAHPVKLVVVDAKTQEKQVIETEWWPKVNNRPVFETVSARTDPSLITFYRPPSLTLSKVVNPNLKNLALSNPCSNWAVIVCGFNDPSDTFHVDTNGIYEVLKSLGLDDSRIFYLSPQTGDPGVDRPTNVANVQWAISQVANQANNNDKVLFFYSAHGGVDSLACAPDVDPVGWISASDLSSWLKAITCKEMSIIIEACHSGSLIGKYRDGTYIASEDDLAGHGESNRIIFTSASTDTSSSGDVDGPDDPNAATDVGSESIYGFIMAYSEASADKNHDGRISFGEAYQYAWDNDVTRLQGVNIPQLREAGLSKDAVYLQCLNSMNLIPPLTTIPMIPGTIPKGPRNPEPNAISSMPIVPNAMTGNLKSAKTTPLASQAP